jgi:hypothetical protein
MELGSKFLDTLVRRDVAHSMTTPSSSQVRPLFRILATIFALVAVPMFVLGIQGPHPIWLFSSTPILDSRFRIRVTCWQSAILLSMITRIVLGAVTFSV